jgi:Tfp pilus assembly protein PilO
MVSKKKIIISISTIIIVTVIVIYFIILPTSSEIKEISRAVHNERVDLEKKYVRGQLLKKTIKDFEKIKPEKYKLISVFIGQGEELKFITELEKIANARKLSQKIELGKVDEKKVTKNSLYSLPLKINLTGNFISIIQYLNDLERSNYYFNISAINFISPNQNNNQNNEVLAILNGDIYILPINK